VVFDGGWRRGVKRYLTYVRDVANGWVQEVPRLCLVDPTSKPSKPGEITYEVVRVLST
jgi:hypothetical protein